MITMLLQGTYSVVDGLFVSNKTGSTGLAAINVAWPIVAVITAVGTGVGCGGAAIMSMKEGAGDREGEIDVRQDTLLLLLMIGIIAVAVFLMLLRPLLILMGANGDLLSQAEIYGRIMVGGGLMQVLSCGLTPILRNQGKTVTAMFIMVGGLLVNLTLDWFFLYGIKAGIAGAAAASVISQTFTVVSCLICLTGSKNLPLRIIRKLPDRSDIRRILLTAVSPFGISLTPSFLILLQNIACLRSDDPLAVTDFALITSTIGSYRLLLIGVAEGMQPLASYTYGARDADGLRWVRNHAIRTAYLVSAVLFVFTVMTARFYPYWYGYSGEAASSGIHAVLMTSPQLIFTGMVRVANSFFYAVGKNSYSMVMIYLDPLVLTPAMLLTIPGILGTNGIWITPDLTQLLLNIIAVWMFARHNRICLSDKDGGIHERSKGIAS